MYSLLPNILNKRGWYQSLLNIQVRHLFKGKLKLFNLFIWNIYFVEILTFTCNDQGAYKLTILQNQELWNIVFDDITSLYWKQMTKSDSVSVENLKPDIECEQSSTWFCADLNTSKLPWSFVRVSPAEVQRHGVRISQRAKGRKNQQKDEQTWS